MGLEAGDVRAHPEQISTATARPIFRRREQRLTNAAAPRACAHDESDDFHVLAHFEQETMMHSDPAEKLSGFTLGNHDVMPRIRQDLLQPRGNIRCLRRVSELAGKLGDLTGIGEARGTKDEARSD